MMHAERASATQIIALPPALRRFEIWTVGLFAVSCCFHLFMLFVMHGTGHSVQPFSLVNRFGDFTIFYDKFQYFGTTRFFSTWPAINYPAPAALFFEFFIKCCAPHPLRCFLAFTVLAFIIPAALFGRALLQRRIATWDAVTFVAILCVLSWPIDLIVDGGNAEVLVWVTLVTAMWAYATGRLWIAAVFFGFAASVKLFPFVFLALFFFKWRLDKLAVGILSFFVTTLVSLKVLGPTIPIAYRGLADGIEFFKQNYMAHFRSGEGGVDHSLFALIKAVAKIVFHHNANTFAGWLSVYLFATAIGGTLLYMLVIRKLPLLNQILALSIACIYFTAFSGDGTLVHLYAPLGMLFLLAVQAYRDNANIPGLRQILLAMVLTLSMESFLVIHSNARFIGQFHCLTLTYMLFAALRYPMGPPLMVTADETVLAHPTTSWIGA